MRFVFLLFTIAACAPSSPTWHEDVRPIMQRSCLGCHGEGTSSSGIALHTYEQASDWSTAIERAVEQRTMPPWLAADDCNNYVDDISLSDEERATLLAWVADGSPEGDPDDAAADLEPIALQTLPRVDKELRLDEPYVPTAQPDDYRCFVKEWDETEPTWVTGFAIDVDNEALLHHAIAFVVPPSDREQYLALDAADPDPGYTCYGGPGGDVQSLIDMGWLGAWAPGSGDRLFPPGRGLRMEPGSLVVLQMHYNLATEQGSSDQSAIGLMMEREPQAWTGLQPWANPGWLFGTMQIPANSTGVEHSFSYTSTGDNGVFYIHDSLVHMHTLGRSARFEVHHADGSNECAVQIDRWDFDWQRSYQLKEPIAIGAGDTIELTCTFDNPTDETITWGDGTGDEMCLAITLLSN